ncbi:MAG: hydrogenase maturation nickel metallochaperone HypA [Deltaproteobacteria bacterium]|nr:hydrogenase maturation nickel metallochaperone HypA [Deltaproteobacteria bacterium]
MTEVEGIAAQLVDGLRAQWPAEVELGGFEVDVGVLLDLDAVELQAALAHLCPGVEVSIKRVEGVLHCLDCGAEYPSEEHPCPACGSNRAELAHGTELGVARAWGRPG